MTQRTARRRAVGLIVLAIVLMTIGEILGAASGTVNSGDTFIWAIALVFSGVGGLIASRLPGNAIGWIFLFVGISAGLGSVAGGYAEYWVGGYGGTESLGEAAAVYGSASWIPFILVPLTFLLLLFPTG